MGIAGAPDQYRHVVVGERLGVYPGSLGDAGTPSFLRVRFAYRIIDEDPGVDPRHAIPHARMLDAIPPSSARCCLARTASAA